MGILPQYAARRARNHEKMTAVLRFLRTATYSTPEILGQIMGVEDRSSIFRCLRKMERAQLIRHHTYRELGGRITLWGITSTGQHQITEDEQETSSIVFNSSKISSSKLLHYLGLQELCVRATKAGWTHLQYCDKLQKARPRHSSDREDGKTANTSRPDLFATSPEGNITAIEYERSLKAAIRYKTDVLPSHVQRLNAKEYDFVLWIAQTPERQARLEKLIRSAVSELKKENAWFLDLPRAEFKRFQFANFTTWPGGWHFALHRSTE